MSGGVTGWGGGVLTEDSLQPPDLAERGRGRRRREHDVTGVVQPLHLAQRHDVRRERLGHP